ncbi:cysteine desulfurase family protein [Patescibacteria group bacterium]
MFPVDLKQLRKELKTNTVFVSVMYVNNEIGTIQPITKIAHILRDYRKNLDIGCLGKESLVFHTDASQAPLYMNMDVHSLGVDLMTIDGQKVYGPKGVGVLFKKKGVEINPLLVGGAQEMGLRAGTENIPLIVGLAKALELSEKDKKNETERLTKIRDHFIDRVLNEIEGSKLNGSREKRLPNSVNISIPNIDTEFMIIKLDSKGIACSSKSACMGKIKQESYVVEALGNGIGNSLRFTLGRSTTKKDIDYTVDVLKKLMK